MTPDNATHESALREDAAARQAALELHSCIVEAPAGAGKTELLTQRFLRLLATVEAPEEVLAITFTNKAAAEMQARILDNLRSAASDTPPANELPPHRALTRQLAGAVLETSARRGWFLLEQPERLRLTTIDALCASLARQMPLLSRFGASPAVTTEAEPLYREAARRTLALLEAPDATYSEPVAAALTYLDNDTGRLQKLLGTMLARRDQWLHRVALEHDSDLALAQLMTDELVQVRAALPTEWEATLMPIVRFAVDTLGNTAAEKAEAPASPLLALQDWTTPLQADPDDLPRWRALTDFLLTGKDEWRKSFTASLGLPPGKEGKPWKEKLADLMAVAPAALAVALPRVRRLPSLTGREGEDEIVAHFAALLKLATAHLWQVFREQGETDFVEVAQRALAALAGPDARDGIDQAAPSELALRLDYRIRHLLVDEFQDTSPTQIALLERLTAGWSAADGRTLFCVGDPMQSIYRFRKADVGLFLRAAERGIGDLPLNRLRLSRNNRSLAPVVEWINTAFARIFPGADDIARGGITYRPSTPTRPDGDGAGVSVHLIAAPELADDGDGSDQDAPPPALDEAEAARVLALIEATWQADPNREIAVLVRARPHLAALVALLRRTRPELRFAAVEVEPLADRPWIADLVSLCHALQHRADRVAWLSVLRSPLCGLTLADLLALCGDDHAATLPALLTDPTRLARLSPDGQTRAGRFAEEYAAVFAARGRLGVDRALEGWWRRLGGPATLPDAAAARDADAFFNLLATLEARRRGDRESLADALDRLYAAPDHAAPDGGPRLQLMTIHKAKGLEFDTVILPGLHRRLRSDEAEMLLWEEVTLPDEAGSHLLVAPLKSAVAAGAASDGQPTAHDYLRRLEAERGRNEGLRVLYVAATRAVRALHLVGAVKAGDDGWAPPGGTPLAELWPALSATERTPAPEAATPLEIRKPETAVSWEAFVPKLQRQQSLPPTETRAQPTTGGSAITDERQSASESGESSEDALVGTLVHRLLELMARDGGAWAVDRLNNAAPPLRQWLAGQGLAADRQSALAERALELLRPLVASRLGQWVLAERPGALAEAALRGEGGIAVVDRGFVDNGERWIVDYKTARLDDAARADSPAGAARRAEIAAAYREQLDRYGRLFAAEGLPQRRAILFVDGPFLVEVAD